MSFHNFIKASNPDITEDQAEFIKKNMTVSQLSQVSNELQARKFEQLQLCLSDIMDVDTVEPAYVEWYGIRLYNLHIVADLDLDEK